MTVHPAYPSICSRSRRPGSIAAGRCGSLGRRAPAAVPGHVDRAPLRPTRQGPEPGAPPSCSRSRRPGSIAAVRCSPSWCTRCTLFPVTSTGLHCGDNCRTKVTDEDWELFPVTSTGLHCGRPFSGVLELGHHCSRSRRPGSIAATSRRSSGVHATSQLFPVTSTGLHCGRVDALHVPPRALGLFPVTSTGLHCGTHQP